MKFLGLNKLVDMIDDYVNRRILNELEKISNGDDLEKVKTLTTIIKPEMIVVKDFGMSGTNSVIQTYHVNIEEQIKELRKLCFHLKNKRKVSVFLMISDLKEIPTYQFFTSTDRFFIDPKESVKLMMELVKEFSDIVTTIKGSKSDVDLDNYYALRSYISNMAFYLESLVRVIMKK